jgi:hypothetical protein
MKLSEELKILVESMKVVLLEEEPSHFQTIITAPNIDWERLYRLSAYHQIRPIFHEACKKINFQNEVVKNVALYTQRQAIKNLNEVHESRRILKLFADEGIPALPYKGLLFLEKLYQNRCLREIADLDLIVQPKNALKALKSLIADGYKICIDAEPNDEHLEELIENTPCLEVSLIKKTKIGMNINIDFHWGINEVPQYNFKLENIFENAQLAHFLKSEFLLPDTESIFKMLINHHGARECWVKLKYFADMMMFKKSNPNLSEAELIKYSLAMHMGKVQNAAAALLDGLFNPTETNLKRMENDKSLKSIVGMWEEADHWRNKAYPRFKFLKIYRMLQDKNMNWFSLFHNQIMFHSKVNFIEEKRLIVFPKKYIYLNALSKLITFLVRVYIHPIFKMK